MIYDHGLPRVPLCILRYAAEKSCDTPDFLKNRCKARKVPIEN